MTIDGANFRIWEPRPYTRDGNKIWYSSKFQGAGLRYEVGICIRTGDIVWFNGPYPCGWGPDIKIFNQKLKILLQTFEKVMADRLYRFNLKCYTKCSVEKYQDKKKKILTPEYEAISLALARHEAINGRMKRFNCLSKVYRNDRNKHHLIFMAVATLVQINMVNGNPPFETHEYDVHISTRKY